VQRCAFRELAEAAAEDSPALGKEAHRRADSRRVVDALDDIVAIGTEAQLEVQTIVDAPAILREERELVAGDFRLDQERRIGRSLRQRTVEANGIHLVTEVVS